MLVGGCPVVGGCSTLCPVLEHLHSLSVLSRLLLFVIDLSSLGEVHFVFVRDRLRLGDSMAWSKRAEVAHLAEKPSCVRRELVGVVDGVLVIQIRLESSMVLVVAGSQHDGGLDTLLDLHLSCGDASVIGLFAIVLLGDLLRLAADEPWVPPHTSLLGDEGVPQALKGLIVVLISLT